MESILDYDGKLIKKRELKELVKKHQLKKEYHARQERFLADLVARQEVEVLTANCRTAELKTIHQIVNKYE